MCRLCGSALVHPRFPRLDLPLLRCDECGVFFRTTQNNLPDPAELYNETYFLKTWPGSLGRFFRQFEPERHHKTRFFIRQLAEFERRFGRPGRLLDVGAANGVFVWLAQRRGWEAEGVEPSPFAVNWGRKQFGVVLHQGTIADIHPENLYDIITLWDTLEHVPDPGETLRLCYQRLRPGGILALLTPDTSSLINLILHAGYALASHRVEPYLKTLYHVDHLTCFNRHALCRALLHQGFLPQWIEGYDEAPQDTETRGPLRLAVTILRLSAVLLHRQHELLCWAEKPKISTSHPD